MNFALPILRKIEFKDAPTWIRWSRSGMKILHGYLRSQAVYIRAAGTGERIARLHCREAPRFGDWSFDDKYISVVEDGRVTIRDGKTGEILQERESFGALFAIWNPADYRIAIGYGDQVQIFTAPKMTAGTRPQGTSVITAAWQNESTLLVAGAYSVIAIDGPRKQKLHFGGARVIAATPDLIALADAGTLLILYEEGEHFLEVGSAPVIALDFSHDGSFLAVLRVDGAVELWETQEWRLLAKWVTSATEYNSLAFSPTANTLAVTAERSLIFYDVSNLDTSATPASVRYTTAKIALVGDSGVGKSGLGWVLTHDAYKEHSSTHGEQFWVAERLSTTRADGTRCEAVVWDLAGQPDYRLIHSLFIDDADVALVLFDPTNRQEPLKGAEFWLRALHASKDKRCRTILIAGRVDRGTGVLTDEEQVAFARMHDVTGGVIATSAQRGDGVEALLQRIAELIDWDSRPATVTIETFNDIRHHVLELKEQQSTEVLWTLERLQAWLRETTGREHASEDIATAVKHLSDHGYVRALRSGTGGRFVLLSPDLLNNLAASIVLDARRNPRGLGALEERRLLGGGYAFPETENLSPEDREVLLDAAATLFIERNVCFRETLGTDAFLIFPSLINQNKPTLEDVPVVEGTAYTATGATENVYASLVVLLGYTNTFTRTNQWRNQAQYEMGSDQICGFRLADEREGQIDLVLYFGERAAPSTRLLFQGLFESFLLARSVDVQIFPPVQCSKCSYTQPRSEVVKRQREAAKQMFCSNCGGRIPLERIRVATTAAIVRMVEDERQIATRRTEFEKAITGLKAYLRDTKPEASPSCFISYAWGDADQERWVERQLATDLRNAGVKVILDRWHSRPGTEIARFIERIESADFVILVGTTRLKRKYDSKTTDAVVTAELKLVNQRLMMRESRSKRVIPILLQGQPSTSFPPLAKTSVHIDFRHTERYFASMFDLLLTLFEIPVDEPNDGWSISELSSARTR